MEVGTRVKRLSVRNFQPIVAVLALFVSLSAWAFASPIGSSPDDDFHLVSIWCSSTAPADLCEPGVNGGARLVPKILVSAPCYAYHPEISASCLDEIGYSSNEKVLTDRGNFSGGYPPVFYATMGLLASSNFELSILLMRFLNIALFIALALSTFLLLPKPQKGVLLWSFLGTSIPLGIFLISSNNPSSWAYIGVGIAWISFLGFVESKIRSKKIALGIISFLASFIAAGSRADASAYIVLGIAVVFILKLSTHKTIKNRLPEIALATVIILLCLLFFLSANQSISAINGFGNPVTAVNGVGGDVTSIKSDKPSGFSLFAFNALNMPLLWEGMLGSWGLGWLDTDMPGVVHLGALAVFISLAFVGIGSLNKLKLVALIAVSAALFVLPLYVLTKGGAFVGTEVQPRYILPLLPLFLGLALLPGNIQKISLSRSQLAVIASTLTVVYFVSLHFNLRRYITGINQMGVNLNDHMQWWWNGMFSPMTLLIIGSVSFAIFCFLTIRIVYLNDPMAKNPVVGMKS